MPLCQPFSAGKAESGAPTFVLDAIGNLTEKLESARDVFGSNANSRIDNRKDNALRAVLS